MDFEFNKSSRCANGVNPVRTPGDALEYALDQGGARCEQHGAEWSKLGVRPPRVNLTARASLSARSTRSRSLLLSPTVSVLLAARTFGET